MKPHRIGIRGYLSDGPNGNRQWKFGEEMKLLFFQQWHWNYSQPAFKLNAQARYHGLQYSTGTYFFSLELSFNVSSALKFNASVKLRLCTLYEDKIKWLSFVTIIVFNNDQKTAWGPVVHTEWVQLCLLWNSFSTLMNLFILLYWSCNKRLSVEILSLFRLYTLAPVYFVNK